MLKRKSPREMIAEMLLQPEPPTISQIIHKLAVEQRLVTPDTARIYAYRERERLISEGHKLNIPQSKTGEKRHETLKPLSDTHRRIGIALNYFRDITEGKTPEQFCALYDYFSPRILRQMELGAFDFTLTDLIQIADVLGKRVSDLVETGAKCQSSPQVSFSNTSTT